MTDADEVVRIPATEEELGEAMEHLLDKCGYDITSIAVVDGMMMAEMQIEGVAMDTSEILHGQTSTKSVYSDCEEFTETNILLLTGDDEDMVVMFAGTHNAPQHTDEECEASISGWLGIATSSDAEKLKAMMMDRFEESLAKAAMSGVQRMAKLLGLCTPTARGKALTHRSMREIMRMMAKVA